jgi:hypothetical protein
MTQTGSTSTSEHEHPPTCTCRMHPWHASMTVRAARDAYLEENGFTIESYESPKTKGSLLGFAFSVPNPPSHQRAIRLHDLLHTATGFGTDHAGEAEISAWQLRRGLAGAGHYVAAIVSFNVLVGLLVAPRRTLGAFTSAGSGDSLFDGEHEYESLLDASVGVLRSMLAIPIEGLAREPRGLHALAPRS